MTIRETSISVAVDDAESVDVVLHSPASKVDALVVLGHGAGGDMHQALLVHLQRLLAAHGFACARFNFPYAQAGRRAPDRAPRLLATWRAVLAALPRPRRLVVGGKSMGGRMASLLVADGLAVDGLLLLGYPLHPAGRPDRLRDQHFDAIACPCLFVQGSADRLCEPRLLDASLSRLGGAVTLHVVEQGDHSFKVPKRTGRSAEAVQADIDAAVLDWLRRT